MTRFPKPERRPKKRNHVRRNITLSKRKMIAELDKIARAEVMERDGEICQRCSKRAGEWDAEIMKPVVIQWSHVHTRRHYCLRWELDAAKAMCSRCHKWWEHNRILAYDWFQKKFPERWERITRVLIANPKVNVKDLWEARRGEKE